MSCLQSATITVDWEEAIILLVPRIMGNGLISMIAQSGNRHNRAYVAQEPTYCFIKGKTDIIKYSNLT